MFCVFSYCFHRQGKKVAIKECIGTQSNNPIANAYNYSNISSKELEDFKQEAMRMKTLQPHQNIVPFCKPYVVAVGI
jgi:hypothetical protein